LLHYAIMKKWLLAIGDNLLNDPLIFA